MKTDQKRTSRRLIYFSWGVLFYNILVILWGAFVRATGSGAGCGSHWPLCNGEVVPQSPQLATVIEFTHRITSGFTLVLVVVLVVWIWRVFPRGSFLRWTSGMAGFFTLTEALIGAGLVLFELVAKNASIIRAFSMMAHLVNTFLLLASLSLTAWWATFGEPTKIRFKWKSHWLLLVSAIGVLFLGASGAIAALGDTLFPSKSLAEGLTQDFSSTANVLLRLRVFHPGIAILVGIAVLSTGFLSARKTKDVRVSTIARLLPVIFVIQLGLGAINVLLLAPIWIQIVHLLFSTLVWILLILLGGSALETS